MIVDHRRDGSSLEEFLRIESRFQNITQIEFCNKKEKSRRERVEEEEINGSLR